MSYNEKIVERILPYLFINTIFGTTNTNVQYPSTPEESRSMFPEFETLFNNELDLQSWTEHLTQVYQFLIQADVREILYQPREYTSRGEIQRSDLMQVMMACSRLSVAVEEIPTLAPFMWSVVQSTPVNPVDNRRISIQNKLLLVGKLDRTIKQILRR